MSIYTDACRPGPFLSKNTLLSLLSSDLDKSKAIIVKTGQVIDISNLSQTIILQNINDGTWVYFENNLPRQLLLTNPNWTITSFNPKNYTVCVDMKIYSGITHFSFLISPPTYKF